MTAATAATAATEALRALPADVPALHHRPRGHRAAGAAAAAALLAVTVAWGSSFVIVKDAVTRLPSADYLGVRFAVAAVGLFLLAPRAVGRLSRAAVLQGVALGAVYGLAQLVQAWGLERTSASVAGFVTSMYVVLTPIFGAIVLRHRIGRAVWGAALVATAGLAVLSLQGFSIGPGVALTLTSAALYAVHILGLGTWANGRDVVGLAFVQLLTVALVCLAFAVPGGIALPATAGDWVGLLYLALVAGALAMIAQTWAQAHLPPARAAVLMTLEPVWAGVFAVTFGGEGLTWRLLVGGGLVLAALYLAEFRASAALTPIEDFPDVAAA